MDIAAGLSREKSNELVRGELKKAGIHVLESRSLVSPVSAVSATVVGKMDFPGGQSITLTRKMLYFQASATGLPQGFELPDCIHQGVPVFFQPIGSSSTWQIDTPAGLAEFARAMKRHFGSPCEPRPVFI